MVYICSLRGITLEFALFLLQSQDLPGAVNVSQGPRPLAGLEHPSFLSDGGPGPGKAGVSCWWVLPCPFLDSSLEGSRESFPRHT